MKQLTAAASCATILCASLVSQAATTGITGGSSPINNQQPSLVMNQLICTSGDFDDLGTIMSFAGNVLPAGFMPAQGQVLPIATNQALYARIGATYGGDGVTTFALPNLAGKVAVGAGGSLGALGTVSGSNSVTLTDATMPVHTHTLPGGGTTAPEGGGQSFSNAQSSLALNFQISTQGIFPARNIITASLQPNFGVEDPLLASVRVTAAATTTLQGVAAANGATLAISQNQALFSLLGTTYGGNGQTTFALPNVNGSTIVGAGVGPGLPTRNLGDRSGSNTTTLTVAQLPAHTHTLPGGGVTGSTGGGVAVDNNQSYATLNYIVALQGIFPSANPDGSAFSGDPYLGEVELFAGNFAPHGWAFADGSALSIVQNEALFALLGTTYGGDGVSTFDLPDLRDRALIGTGVDTSGVYTAGEELGSDSYTISIAQMASHDHDYAATPEPATMTIAGVAAMLFTSRRKRL